MENKKLANNEKAIELELIAFGCNRRVFHNLSNFLNQLGIQSFTFYEFFCAKPISKNEPITNIELLCPFIKRYSIGSPLLPIDAELKGETIIINRRIRNREHLKEFYEPIKIILNETNNPKEKGDTWKVLNNWKEINSWTKWDPFQFIQGKNQCKNEVQNFIIFKGKDEFINYVSSNQKEQRREFAIVDAPWWEYLTNNHEKKVAFIYMPIASDNFFYGELLLIVASEEIGGNLNENSNNYTSQNPPKIIEILKKLKIISDKDYLPLLIIFENYWHEKELKNELEKKGEAPKVENPFGNGNNKLEKIFSDMWEWRKQQTGNQQLLEESLIMAKYIVASPCMIKKVEEAISMDLKDSCKPPIPCILIVGEPGTGKEKMAWLVAKYSEHFRTAKIYTINMASLQPRQLAGPLLSGFSSKSLGGIGITGLLNEIIEDSPKEAPVVIIFDELNSLDVDAQGTLLRLIENREFASVGGFHQPLPVEKKIMIIGNMNEDPEKLAKLAAIHSIVREKEIFVGLLGEIMYEYVRNLRRLRDDIYYRMKRNLCSII